MGVGEHLLLDNGSTIRFGAAFTRHGYKRILPRPLSQRQVDCRAAKVWLVMPLVIEFESDSDRSQDLRRMHESSNHDGKRRVCQFNRRMLMLSLNAVTGQWKITK
jgi:hypothetical protein